MGPEAGVESGGLQNRYCKNADPPIESQCTSGWKYSKNGWLDDPTMRIQCKGNMHNKRQYKCIIKRFLLLYGRTLIRREK